jgi:ribose 5-phosphate isomerase B
MKIAIGADHAGFRLKEVLKRDLIEKGYEVTDFGAASDQPSDYPDVAYPVSEHVSKGKVDRAVLICGNGVGMSLVANKVAGVRAALCGDTYTARTSRAHNDANVLCLGARATGSELAREILAVWLGTDFSGEERHERRLGKVRDVEKECGIR